MAQATPAWSLTAARRSLEPALLLAHPDRRPAIPVSEAPVRPCSREFLAVRQLEGACAVRLVVAVLALIAVTFRRRENATAVQFAVAELALVAGAIREGEDTSAICLAAPELALVALVGLSIHEPLEGPVTLGGSLRAGPGPGDRRIRVRFRVLIPDLASGSCVGDPPRLRGHGKGEQDRRGDREPDQYEQREA